MTHTEKVVTLNDDFTDRLTDATALLEDGTPFAILIQEGKNTRFRRVLRRLRRRLKARANQKGDEWLPLGYQTVQDMTSEATRGLAIIWDSHTAPMAFHRWKVLVEPHGAAMNARGILWVVVDHKDWGYIILATTHRPPWRYRRLWPEYDKALQEWVDAQGYPILLGMDANTRRFMRLGAYLGLLASGQGIDAVMAKGFRLKRPRRLKRRNSDHRPVAVDATR